MFENIDGYPGALNKNITGYDSKKGYRQRGARISSE